MVICERGLIAKVGQSTRCDVTMSPAYGIQPTITVSGVENGKVSYSMTPAVSKTQLEAAVADMVTRARKAAPDSVVCQSGLEGKQGAVALCDITDDGFTSRRTALVSEVSGLAMNYGLTPVLEKSVAESSLATQLGQSPSTVKCDGDVDSKVGATQRCTAVVGGQNRAYTLSLWCMFCQVVPMFANDSIIAVQSVNNPDVNLDVSIIALTANVLALGYVIYRSK